MGDAFDRDPSLKVKLDSAIRGGSPEADLAGHAVGSRVAVAGAAGPVLAAGEATAAAAGFAAGLMAAAFGAAAPAAPTAETVSLRLAVDEADRLDAGSLALAVDELPVDIAPDGLVELPPTAGVRHRLVATGRLHGRAMRGELQITASVDDEGRGMSIVLR